MNANDNEVVEVIEIVHEGFLTIKRIKVVIKCEERIYEQLFINGAVAALVIDTEGKIGLVHQFRPAAGKIVAEIPAGTLDKEGEKGISIIIGEIDEEMHITDIISAREEPIIGPYYMMIGCCDGKMSIHLIRVPPQKDIVVNDGDVICTEWVDIDTFGRYIDEGLIVDSKSIMAYWYLMANSELLFQK